jgi:L-lactate dehydrogenase complex protein LldG
MVEGDPPVTATHAHENGSAREEILARIRSAIGSGTGPEARNANGNAHGTSTSTSTSTSDPIERSYRSAHAEHDLVELLADNLADYRAKVHRCTEPETATVIARLLSGHDDHSAAIPQGLPEAWLEHLRESEASLTLVPDSPTLTAQELDRIDAVVTTCALAIAETGTIVLDTGPGQGRRMLTLIPDHHICVVRCPEQLVASIPQALPRLDPARPQTWIAGPSATSDIELDRVEGVHGPRHLDVILVSPALPTPASAPVPASSSTAPADEGREAE